MKGISAPYARPAWNWRDRPVRSEYAVRLPSAPLNPHFSPRSWSARRCPADRAGKPCSASRVHPRGTHDAGLNRRRRYASRPACLAYRWFVHNGITLALDSLSFLFRHCSYQMVRHDLRKRIVSGLIRTRAYPGGRLSAKVRPGRCLVDGAGEALGLDEGLDQHGRGVVALGPILGQLAADEGEDVRAPLVVRAELEIVHRALSAKTGRAAPRRLRRRIRGCPVAAGRNGLSRFMIRGHRSPDWDRSCMASCRFRRGRRLAVVPPQTDWSNWMTEPVIMPLSWKPPRARRARSRRAPAAARRAAWPRPCR